jgi:hypothetical protein
MSPANPAGRGWSRAYRLALFVLPSHLRHKHGEAMQALFERELSSTDRFSSRMATTVVAMMDVLGRAPYEWGHVAGGTHPAAIAADALEYQRPVGTSDMMRRLVLPFAVAFVAFTAMMLANYANQRSFAPPAHLERLLLAVPFTAALTIPAALFLAVAWASRQLRRATGSRVMPRGLRRSVLVVASGVAAFMLVFTSEIVPRANLRLQTVQMGRQARRNDRSMTIMELQQAAASLRAGVNPSSSTQQARDLREQEVGYRVEIQKKLVLAVSCLVLALAALALGWHSARAHAAVLVAAGIALCVLWFVSVMAGEALAESLVVPPIIAMWAGTELLLLMTLPALRSKRAVA